MRILLLLLFLGIPAAEIALFIQIGGEIGLGWTLACILATALAGAALVRHQGLQTLARARSAIAENRMPLGEVISGICILVAGALLLTPGFLTDALGFILLIPVLRTGLAGDVIRRMATHGEFNIYGATTGSTSSSGPKDRGGNRSADNKTDNQAGDSGTAGPIIEGTFEEVTPNNPPKDKTSPWHKNEAPAGNTETSGGLDPQAPEKGS